MNDYEIREVLCNYIDSQNNKVRIIDELVIGNARADIVTVTDHLTGYEIKGDGDSYIRLPLQIKEYDKHFNENYLVVGASHRKSAESHVPAHWGIICVFYEEEKAQISVLREPGSNPKFKIKAQLKLLWRRELANILKINQMPKYAGKSRAFINSKILERISLETIEKQICEEFFERDWSQFFK
jgi:hypothetical protein